MNLVVYNVKSDARKYSKEFLEKLLRNMLLQRVFDQSVIQMISEGKIAGFYHAGSGQEAIAAGVIADMTKEDYLFYMHRGCNEMICKGLELNRLYSDFFGNINGSNRGLGAGIIHSTDPALGIMGQPGTIGSNMPIAAGLGMSIKYRKTNQVVYATFGDGTSSRELLHGSFNLCALHKLPVIYVCQNNEYAIGAYYKTDHATSTGYIAEYGTSYGIPSYVVDGNDVLAVYEVASEAIRRARSGECPTFIEAKTFRHNGHFVGDPITYMDMDRLEWFKKYDDPITNFKKQLLEYEIFTAEELQAIDKEIEEFNKAEIAKAESYPMPTEERLYAGLFSTSPSPV